MKNFILKASTFALIILSFLWTVITASAQNTKTAANTKSPMIYHGGPVMTATPDLFFIWYGCWTDNCGNNGSTTTTALLTDFASNVGGTPYFAINTSYPNVSGLAPSGGLLYAGSVYDSNYSHGTELTENDIAAIVKDHIESNSLPQDPSGIYIVVASADVGSTATGRCTAAGSPPLHGNVEAFGSFANYGFIGNPKRCPALAGPQFVGRNGNLLPTPNDDFAGDVMASDLAHVLNTIVTNPYFDGGWYDRYGLENADKCTGIFGTTFTTTNGARANWAWGPRNYLIQQNWVNDKKGHCGMILL